MSSVRIITSRPHRLFQHIVREIGMKFKQNEPTILLVPEQFTLQAERELMQRLHLHGFFTINVLSPSRLYEHVLEAAGRDDREPLSDAGRRMAVSQALERLEDQLGYYGSIARRQGFVEKITALITDMKRGGMDPETLDEYAATLQSNAQKEKFADLSKIFAQYRTVLKDRFSDSEDQLEYVAGKLEQSQYLNDQHMYVYGFDTLPEHMMSLLCAAAPIAKSLTVALLCDDEPAADAELFLPVRQGIGRFTDMLLERGIKVGRVILPKEELEHAAPIRHIDHMLFSFAPRQMPEPQEHVFLFSGMTPFEEATTMTRHVLWLLSQGVNIERIAVLYPDSNGYEFAATAALTDSGIPFYTDQKLPATSHGLIRYLLSALHAIADGYRNQDVLGMIKSGYAPLTFEEGCALENYAYQYGINRKRWLAPFTKGKEEERIRCEAFRLRLIEPLIRARADLVAARDTVSSMTAAFGLLTDIGAYETLKQEEEKLLANGLQVRANQNSQVWQAILALFDQLSRLGDGARIPLKHIASRLECGFSAISLAALPPATGMLHAGTLGHSLSEDVDAVFLLGLNDGILARDSQSLLTPEERAKAQTDTGCFLGLTDDSRALFAKLDIKRAMTLPKQWLFLSFAKTAPDGKALRPVALLNTLQTRIFSGLPQSPVSAEELPLSSPQALAQLSLLLRAYQDGALINGLSDHWKGILHKLQQSSATASAAMHLLRALDFDASAQPLSPAQARALFGDAALSVSRLEQFADCPFKHFVNYGLRPEILREWKIDPIETGTFYHASLSNFSKLAKKNESFPHLSTEAVTQMADEAIEPLIQELLTGPMGDGERSQARFELAKNAIRKAAVTITRQLASGSFTLYQTEASFGYDGGMPPIVLSLADGKEIMLRGRIDRIDRYDSADSVYLRVIDYKSSQQSLDAARTWWGLQLQLLLYLDVCIAAIPGSKPAGAFYFYVADPLIESSTDLAPIVEGKLREVFQLRGITLSDVEILNAADSGEVKWVLPSVHQKSGGILKTAKALDMDQFTSLLAHARSVATSLADDLFGGKNEILPTRNQDMVSCTYCDFRVICHFDANSPDAPLRELPKMNMEDLRRELSKP